jgi:uncharacterized membrane protein YhaH (DUF805 family)
MESGPKFSDSVVGGNVHTGDVIHNHHHTAAAQPDPFQAPPQSILIGAPTAVPMQAVNPYGQIMPGMGRPAKMMSFGDSLRSVMGHYLTFDGRASRSEYWWFYLAVTITSMTVGMAALGFAIQNNDEDAFFNVICFAWIAILLLMPAFLSVTVRRLHDQGYSGWYILLGFIPYIGGLIVFVMMFGEGEEVPNAYGPPPTNLLM